MSNERSPDIDRLLHDAEHAQSGVLFAEMMMGQQPSNPDHRAVRDEMRNKAARLIAEAHAADPKHLHEAWEEADLDGVPEAES